MKVNRELIGDMEELENFLPRRARSGGQQPGMQNDHLKGPNPQRNIEASDQFWIHTEPPISRKLRRKILGKVVEVGVHTLFKTFVYTFGGELFLQIKGAPIGTRVSCAAANLATDWVWDSL